MKVLFFHIGVPTPIFETELELIRKHEKSGDIVRVFQCTGNLGNCHWNQERKESQCAACRSRFRKGWSVLNPGRNVELKQFPPKKFLPSDLPGDFRSVEELKQYRYDGEGIGMGVASSLISIYREHRLDTRVHRKEVARELNTSVQVYETLKQEFEEFKPDRLYVFNGRISGHLPAVLLCKRIGINFFTYEVAGTLNRYLLRENSTSHSIPAMREEMETLWAAGGPEREKMAKAWFERKRAGVDQGTMMSFTKHQARGLLPEGYDPEKKNIAIFNSTLDEYTAVEGWENPLYFPDETAGIRRILEAFESDKRYVFHLRAHPHMKNISRSRNSQLRDIGELASRFGNLRVIWPAESIDSYALIDACEKIITFGSTVGVEAAYWGKPSILAGRATYESFDCVYTPKTHEELVMLLEKDLPPLPADSALKFGFRELSHGIPFDNFKQTGVTSGTFDGVEIKADMLPWVWFKIIQSIWRIKRVLLEPSLIKTKISDKQPS